MEGITPIERPQMGLANHMYTAQQHNNKLYKTIEEAHDKRKGSKLVSLSLLENINMGYIKETQKGIYLLFNLAN